MTTSHDNNSIASAYALRLTAGSSVGDLLMADAVHRPSGTSGGGAVAAELQRSSHPDCEVCTVIVGADRAGIITTWDSPDGRRFESLDVLTMVDGLIVDIIQLDSTTNTASESATLPPTVVRAPSASIGSMTDDAIVLVQRFYAEVFGQGDPTAVDHLVSEAYIQHNPWIKQGRAGLRTLVERTGAAPMFGLGEGGVFGDGDFVVHLSVLPMGTDFFLVDVFRIAQGQLAEHWDFTPVGMALPPLPEEFR
jgi:predicted SnoaL-like aldol condensation-catalyzing enzyme